MTALVLISALIGGATGAAMRGHARVEPLANESGSPAGALEPERPITLQQRATVAATVETLAPTLSMNGRVAGRHHGRYIVEAEPDAAAAAYRLTTRPTRVTVSILGGPDALPCAFLGTRASDQPDGSVTLSCALPRGTRAITGLQTFVVAQLGRPRRTLALPASAVRGDEDQGQVVVVTKQGTAQVRSVHLGVHDGLNVQIVSGLAAGDRVLARPISIDFGGSGG